MLVSYGQALESPSAGARQRCTRASPAPL